MAVLFYHRLKPRPIDRVHYYDTLDADDGAQSVVPQKAPRRSFPLVELSGNGLPRTLSTDGRDEAAELPGFVEGTRHT